MQEDVTSVVTVDRSTVAGRLVLNVSMRYWVTRSLRPAAPALVEVALVYHCHTRQSSLAPTVLEVAVVLDVVVPVVLRSWHVVRTADAVFAPCYRYCSPDMAVELAKAVLNAT